MFTTSLVSQAHKLGPYDIDTNVEAGRPQRTTPSLDYYIPLKLLLANLPQR
jgi:hypothetical protein